jgi:hypothetical protein
MTTAKEYREFAAECLRWSAASETEDGRDSLLEFAGYLTRAALRLERALTSSPAAGRTGDRPLTHSDSVGDNASGDAAVVEIAANDQPHQSGHGLPQCDCDATNRATYNEAWRNP